jgi:hypothetical protein
MKEAASVGGLFPIRNPLKTPTIFEIPPACRWPSPQARGGIFRVHHRRASPGFFIGKTMEAKNECVTSIVQGLQAAAKWRAVTGNRFPDDPRNARAVAKLTKLATEMPDMPDELWEQLRPHYHWASLKWRDALSQAARQVGFVYPSPSLKLFLSNLVCLLNQSTSVAA